MDKYIEYNTAIEAVGINTWAGARISQIPAADVAPVRHGKWIRKRTVEHEGEWYCSICGKDMLYTWGPGCGLADYCPHCGAKMDGE